MAKKKYINWAIFDQDLKYLGGLVLPEGKDPAEITKPPEGGKVEQVSRFPQHHETWDPKNKSWQSDLKAKREAERIANIQVLAPDEKTQRWVLSLLTRLNIEVGPQTVREFFPRLEKKS